MNSRKLVVLSAFLCLIISAYASSTNINSAGDSSFHLIDSLAQNAPNGPDIATVAAYLSKSSSNDMEKARAAFSWVAANIKYDDNAYNSGKIGDMSAQVVLKRKHAVCEGYANLYKALGEAMGLEVEKIDGYAKAYGYRPGEKFSGDPNHSWNAVKVNGQWLLLDATWGAGFSDGGRGNLKSHKLFTPYWFNVDKYEFLFMHFPSDVKWQLISQPVVLKQFEEMPYLHEAYFQMGFNAHDILDKFIAKTLPKKLPEVFAVKYDLRLVDFPLSEVITHEKEVTFTILCKEDVDIEFVNDPKKWVRMQRWGDGYRIISPLKAGDLQFAIKGKGKDYDVFIKYKVK